MKVTAFIGSARRKHTWQATEKFLHHLQSMGNVEYEMVALSDQNLGICKGCKLCLDKGEELCPHKDDRDMLIEKIMQSDGVVFATPNYSFQMSAWMKIFLDRLGFLFHRPRFFGKTFTSIVAQGVYKGEDIVKYFDFVGNGLGFNVVRGSCITTIEPLTEEGIAKIDDIIAKHSQRFYTQLVKKEYPVPSLIKLMIFRMSRSSMQVMLNQEFRDYNYYRDKGWFASDYYYPVELGPVKRSIGNFFDRRATHVAETKSRVGIF